MEAVILTLKEYLNSSNRFKYEWTDLKTSVQQNVVDLLIRLNILRRECGIPFIPTSGYRSPQHAIAIGSSPRSTHCFGKSIDLKDPHGEIYKWLKNHPKDMEELGFWVEHERHTGLGKSHRWIHIQTKPASRRFFYI